MELSGAVMSQLTDENGNNSSVSYNDANYWRPASTTDQAGIVTNVCYGLLSSSTGTCTVNLNEVESTLNFNSNNSSVDTLITFDSLGRPHVQQKRQSPSATNFDSNEIDYDAMGRPSRTTLPYTGIAGQTNASVPAVATTYDALGRPRTVADASGGTTTYTYSQNDVLAAVSPAPSGENNKQHQLEYDGLGRLTSVCEITGGTTAWPAASCGQNTSATGYLTKYGYDALGNLISVIQNAQSGSNQQTRTYTFDAMSRLTSETNPESGTTNYSYDVIPSGCANSGSSSAGDMTKKTDAAGHYVCPFYDALHRVTDVGSDSSCKRFRYDNTNGVLGAKPSGVIIANPLARLVEAETDTCAWPITQSSIITDEWVSYTPRGEVSDIYESSPHSGGYYHITQSYWANGLLYQLGNNIASLPAFTYSPDAQGRPSQVSASSGQNPVTGVTYNTSSLPTQVNFGSGDSDIFSYDSNTLRMTQFKFNVGTQSQYLNGALTWNTNGTLGQLAITDQFNSANTQTCNYVHDDLVRIASANCGSAANQTFSYDPFGNLNKSGSPYSFNPTYSASTNRMTSIGGFTPTYDADGNVTNDSLHTYAWDAYGNSTTVDTVGLTFDALDRMVEQNRSGSYSQIIYGPTGTKLALMNGQTLTKAFVPLPGRATAVYTSSGLDHYRHSDWLGSSRLTSSPSRAYLSSIAYAPYGETYASSGTTDPSFTGQNPDSVSTDYDFLHREYSIQGRWPSPDPAGLAAVNPTSPQSWNRYAYVLNNPTEYADPSGLCPLIVAGFKDSPENSPDLLAYARQIGADVAFPYAGQGVVADVGSVIAQDLGAVNSAVQTTEAALQDAGSASQNEGGGNAVNVITFSGGAQAASSAINDLGNVDLTSAIYLEPGTGLITGLITGLPQGTNQSAIVRGKGFLNGFLNLFTRSHGIPVSHTDCGHSASCVFNQLSNGTSAVTPQNTDPCSNPQIFAPGRAPQPLFPGGGGGGGVGDFGCTPPTWVPIFLTFSGSEGGSGSYFAGWWYIPGSWKGPTY